MAGQNFLLNEKSIRKGKDPVKEKKGPEAKGTNGGT
jgi:hypothetical protein